MDGPIDYSNIISYACIINFGFSFIVYSVASTLQPARK